MNEIGKRLLKGVLEFEVMKILRSRPTNLRKIRKQIVKSLCISLDMKTITQILHLMKRNGYIKAELSKPRLTQNYALTSEGETLFEQTWQSINLTTSVKTDKLAKWMSIYLAARDVKVNEQIIRKSLKDYQAEEMLRAYLAEA
jgi:DNA-binding PadR family transcriptional regulator